MDLLITLYTWKVIYSNEHSVHLSISYTCFLVSQLHVGAYPSCLLSILAEGNVLHVRSRCQMQVFIVSLWFKPGPSVNINCHNPTCHSSYMCSTKIVLSFQVSFVPLSASVSGNSVAKCVVGVTLQIYFAMLKWSKKIQENHKETSDFQDCFRRYFFLFRFEY